MSDVTVDMTHGYGGASPAGDPHEVLGRFARPALIVGVAAALLLVLGGFISREGQFFRSYLFAFLFWVGVPLGCLGLLMLQHMTGGNWGLVIRRICEAGTRMLYLMPLFFLPLIFGIPKLYPWAREGYHAEGFKHTWLDVNFFIVRAIIYFIAWLALAFIFNKWSGDEDRTGDPRTARRMQMLAGPGIVIYVVMMTFASFDWVMSLDPDWYSTIFGLIFVVGQALSVIAMSVLILAMLRDRRPFAGLLTTSHFHDLGNLMLAFTMLWAYMSFSQFLIIWSGNIAEETPYYYYRLQTAWRWIGLILVVGHFVVPFLLLLGRPVKRSLRWLPRVAVLILVMRFVDLKWFTGPAYVKPIMHGTIDGQLPALFGTGLHWMDFVAPFAIGGIWVFVFVWQLRRSPLLPPNDPRLIEAQAAAAAGAHH